MFAGEKIKIFYFLHITVQRLPFFPSCKTHSIGIFMLGELEVLFTGYQNLNGISSACNTFSLKRECGKQ